MLRRAGLTYLRVRLGMKDQEGLGEAFSKEPLHCFLDQGLESDGGGPAAGVGKHTEGQGASRLLEGQQRAGVGVGAEARVAGPGREFGLCWEARGHPEGAQGKAFCRPLHRSPQGIGGASSWASLPAWQSCSG